MKQLCHIVGSAAAGHMWVTPVEFCCVGHSSSGFQGERAQVNVS